MVQLVGLNVPLCFKPSSQIKTVFPPSTIFTHCGKQNKNERFLKSCFATNCFNKTAYFVSYKHNPLKSAVNYGCFVHPKAGNNNLRCRFRNDSKSHEDDACIPTPIECPLPFYKEKGGGSEIDSIHDKRNNGNDGQIRNPSIRSLDSTPYVNIHHSSPSLHFPSWPTTLSQTYRIVKWVFLGFSLALLLTSSNENWTRIFGADDDLGRILESQRSGCFLKSLSSEFESNKNREAGLQNTAGISHLFGSRLEIGSKSLIQSLARMGAATLAAAAGQAWALQVWLGGWCTFLFLALLANGEVLYRIQIFEAEIVRRPHPPPLQLALSLDLAKQLQGGCFVRDALGLAVLGIGIHRVKSTSSLASISPFLYLGCMTAALACDLMANVVSLAKSRRKRQVIPTVVDIAETTLETFVAPMAPSVDPASPCTTPELGSERAIKRTERSAVAALVFSTLAAAHIVMSWRLFFHSTKASLRRSLMTQAFLVDSTLPVIPNVDPLATLSRLSGALTLGSAVAFAVLSRTTATATATATTKTKTTKTKTKTKTSTPAIRRDPLTSPKETRETLVGHPANLAVPNRYDDDIEARKHDIRTTTRMRHALLYGQLAAGGAAVLAFAGDLIRMSYKVQFPYAHDLGFPPSPPSPSPTLSLFSAPIWRVTRWAMGLASSFLLRSLVSFVCPWPFVSLLFSSAIPSIISLLAPFHLLSWKGLTPASKVASVPYRLLAGAGKAPKWIQIQIWIRIQKGMVASAKLISKGLLFAASFASAGSAAAAAAAAAMATSLNTYGGNKSIYNQAGIPNNNKEKVDVALFTKDAKTPSMLNWFLKVGLPTSFKEGLKMWRLTTSKLSVSAASVTDANVARSAASTTAAAAAANVMEASQVKSRRSWGNVQDEETKAAQELITSLVKTITSMSSNPSVLSRIIIGKSKDYFSLDFSDVLVSSPPFTSSVAPSSSAAAASSTIAASSPPSPSPPPSIHLPSLSLPSSSLLPRALPVPSPATLLSSPALSSLASFASWVRSSNREKVTMALRGLLHGFLLPAFLPSMPYYGSVETEQWVEQIGGKMGEEGGRVKIENRIPFIIVTAVPNSRIFRSNLIWMGLAVMQVLVCGLQLRT